jgi:glycosyltransferase involved in cell wall biosynthesis
MLRVLHGPYNIGNHAWMLSRFERQLGVHSELVVNYSTWLKYNADRCLGQLGRLTIRDAWRRLYFGLSAPFRYDVLHYYFGRTHMCWDDWGPANLLWYTDLKLARKLGRRVLMTLQGCDVRISAESAAHNTQTPCRLGCCKAAPVCRATLDANRREMIRDVLPLVDRRFIQNPDLAHFVPDADFLPYSSIDVEATEVAPPGANETPVLLHAPTDESIKGSARIIQAVERVRQHFPLELVLVKNVPHAEALKLYRRADLIIDQILAGWYGNFAVEAMAMGKPVVAYIREEDLGALPPAMRADLPIVRVSPATLEEDLAQALARRAEWPEWGRRGRAYALRWHNPRSIAAALLRVYRDPTASFEMRPEPIAYAA